MQSIRHKDVWMEIIHHFKLSLSEDKPSDIKIKKHTLLSLALTNRNLTDIALNELWRSMSSLMPIVRILNDTTTTTTSSSAAVTPVLRWNRDYWVSSFISGRPWRTSSHDWAQEIGSLSSSANKCLVSRISLYLSRVESLHFSVFPSLDEYMLWHALSTFEQITPICPRLRELSISIDAKSASWAYNVTPLVASRSLKRIKLDASPDTPTAEMAASVILDTLKYRNAEISVIDYTGFTSCRIIQRIMSFPSLSSVAVSSSRRNGDVVMPAHVACFQEMRNLNKLDINLSLFYSALQDVGKWLETLVSLSCITLRGTFQQIHQCIKDRQPMKSIHSCALYIQAQKVSLDRVAVLVALLPTIAPNIRALCLEMERNSRLALLSLSDLMSLRERPMEAFVIRRSLSLNNPTKDLIDIITAWPTLQRLSIEPQDAAVGDASDVLLFMSGHASSLQEATLPLKFAPKWMACTAREVVCPLQHLGLVSVSGVPTNISNTLALSRSLIELFPRLSTVSGSYVAELQDLQTAIKMLQNVLACPPRRPDRLFR